MLSLDGFGLARAADADVLDIDAVQAITIEAWVKHDGQSDADAFLVNKGTDGEGYRLQFVGDGDEPAVRFAIRNIDSGSWGIVSNAGVPKDRWTHVAGVYNGAQMQVYINGELDNSIEFGPYTPGANANALTFGAADGGVGNFYSGMLDDVRIWSAPKTGFEMAISPFLELTGEEDNLRAFFDFSSTSGINGTSLELQGGAALAGGNVHPIAPDAFVAEVGPGSVGLTWQERTGPNGQNDAAAFRVYRSTGLDGADRQLLATLGGGAGSYDDAGVESGQLYSYEVAVVDAEDRESEYSPPVVARPYSFAGGGSLLLGGGSYGSMSDRPSLEGSLNNVVNFADGITIEAWVKHDGQSDADAFLVNKGTDGEGYRLQFVGEGDGPRLRFAIRNIDSGSWDVISETGVPAHRWTHVAAVYNGAQIQLYVNGELDVSNDFGQYVPGLTESALTVGASDNGTGHFFSGRIDDLRVWNTARTAFDLRGSPYRPLTGTEDHLVTYFRFDEVDAGVAQSADVLHADMVLERGATLETGGVFPVPPTLVARAGATSAELRWTERVLNPEAGEAAAVRVYRSTDPEGGDRQLLRTLSGGETTFTDGGLAPDTGYFYETTVEDASGKESGYSPTAFVSTGNGGAVRFDGASGHVVVGHHAALDGSIGPYVNFDQTMTVELWVNHDGDMDPGAFLVNKGTDGEGYRLQFEDGGANPRVRFAIRNIDSGSWGVVSTGTVPANEWVHVAAVYNGAQMLIYINGLLEASTDFGSYFPGINDNALTIGASDNGVGNFFRGSLDDVRIWAVPRSQSEINQDLDEELYGDEEGLLAYFRFDEPGGGVVYSSSVYPLTGALGAGATFTTASAPVPTEGETASSLELGANAPNPFQSSTTITFTLAEPGPARLVVYDALGREVARLADGPHAAGAHEVRFNAAGLPGGTYFYRLEAAGRHLTRSMVAVK